jgi:hypothetical protein
VPQSITRPSSCHSKMPSFSTRKRARDSADDVSDSEQTKGHNAPRLEDPFACRMFVKFPWWSRIAVHTDSIAVHTIYP